MMKDGGLFPKRSLGFDALHVAGFSSKKRWKLFGAVGRNFVTFIGCPNREWSDLQPNLRPDIRLGKGGGILDGDDVWVLLVQVNLDNGREEPTTLRQQSTANVILRRCLQVLVKVILLGSRPFGLGVFRGDFAPIEDQIDVF